MCLISRRFITYDKLNHLGPAGLAGVVSETRKIRYTNVCVNVCVQCRDNGFFVFVGILTGNKVKYLLLIKYLSWGYMQRITHAYLLLRLPDLLLLDEVYYKRLIITAKVYFTTAHDATKASNKHKA